MLQVCQGIRKPNAPAVRERIQQIESAETFKGRNRKKLHELRENYEFVEAAFANCPNNIMICDDVLTTGSHFRALKDMILEKKPGAKVIGLFIARRQVSNPFAGIDLSEFTN
jgi:predicted amidophosphoribosyltransferase